MLWFNIKAKAIVVVVGAIGGLWPISQDTWDVVLGDRHLQKPGEEGNVESNPFNTYSPFHSGGAPRSPETDAPNTGDHSS